jgi:hypothetical protein
MIEAVVFILEVEARPMRAREIRAAIEDSGLYTRSKANPRGPRSARNSPPKPNASSASCPASTNSALQHNGEDPAPRWTSLHGIGVQLALVLIQRLVPLPH